MYICASALYCDSERGVRGRRSERLQSYLRRWFAGRYQSWIWAEAGHQFVDRDISAGQIGEGQHPGIGDYRN